MAVAGEDTLSPKMATNRTHLTREGSGAVGGLGEGWWARRGEWFGPTGNWRWHNNLGQTFT